MGFFMFWCTDEDGMGGLFNFTAYKLASFIFGTNARSSISLWSIVVYVIWHLVLLACGLTVFGVL